MRLAFAGTPEVALPSLEAIATSRHDLALVLTRPDAGRGRGRELAPSPVAARAESLGVPVLKPTTLRDPAVAAGLADAGVECCPVVAFGGLVPADLLTMPPHGWVNLHFSLLPAWRGAAPVQHALLAGDTVTGATTFRLDEGLDTGPVFGTITEQVRPDDTAGTVLARLAEAGAHLLVATLDGIEQGSVVPHEQSPDGVSLAPKLTTEDARVRWTDPALSVARRIRACTPAPGAWTTAGDIRVGLLPLPVPDATAGSPPASTFESSLESSLAPGELRVTKHDVWVGTGSYDVRLGEVRPSGKRAMPAADWARGARLVDGAMLT